MALIAIVEDDPNILEIETYALKSDGHEVFGFSGAGAFYTFLEERLPDLAILDVMLPGDDGISVLTYLRTHAHTEKIPVVMVTAKSSEMDAVKGLDQGADDYITKPFGVMELLSRVRAVLRRTRTEAEETVFRYRSIQLDTARRTCYVDNEKIELTFKEFELLRFLLLNAGIVLTRDQLMDEVWGFAYAGESRTLDMHIKTLRKKLGALGGMIATVRNVGYKLE